MYSLEDLYSPSKWALLPAGQVIEKHIEFVSKESAVAKLEVPCLLNVSYGQLEDQKFDIYGTDLSQDAPIFIYIHGGYWQQLNRTISSYIARPLYKNGIKTIVLGYMLCPKNTLSGIVNDIKLGFETCLKYNENYKSSKIIVGGHSAGAHLTASLYQDLTGLPPRMTKHINSVFLISGIYDLTPLVETSVNAALKLEKTTAENLSPHLHHVSGSTSKTKFFVVCAEHDSPAFKTQSEQFYNKLRKLGNKTEFIVYKDVDHFSIVENLSCEKFELLNLIVDQFSED